MLILSLLEKCWCSFSSCYQQHINSLKRCLKLSLVLFDSCLVFWPVTHCATQTWMDGFNLYLTRWIINKTCPPQPCSSACLLLRCISASAFCQKMPSSGVTPTFEFLNFSSLVQFCSDQSNVTEQRAYTPHFPPPQVKVYRSVCRQQTLASYLHLYNLTRCCLS